MSRASLVFQRQAAQRSLMSTQRQEILLTSPVGCDPTDIYKLTKKNKQTNKPWLTLSQTTNGWKGVQGALELNTTCQSSLVGKAVPDLTTRWGPPHRTSGLATGFIREVPEACLKLRHERHPTRNMGWVFFCFFFEGGGWGDGI